MTYKFVIYLWSIYVDNCKGCCDAYASSKQKACSQNLTLMDNQWEKKYATYEEHGWHWTFTTQFIYCESSYEEPRQFFTESKEYVTQTIF